MADSITPMDESVAQGFSVVGSRLPRLDSFDKVTGRTRYTSDLPVPGLLHARPVLALHAHARIVEIETSLASRHPGVVAVLTAGDIPVVGSGDGRSSSPLAKDEVHFVGQPVAFVVALTEAAAADGADLVQVTLEPLPVVTDPESAILDDSPLARPRPRTSIVDGSSAHAAAGGNSFAVQGDLASPSENLTAQHRFRHGDPDGDLRRCRGSVSARFTTSWTYQAYLEPQSAIAYVEPDGRLTLITSSQGIFHVRAQLAEIYGLRPDLIRVIGAPLGGAFGGKIMFIESLVAGIALAIKQPVRLVLSRREDMAMANPAQAMTIELSVGGDRDGLRVLRARAILDAGAFAEWSVEALLPTLLAGPYRWQSWDVQAVGVETNHVGTGSYRAPGAPQATFALESLVDELAIALEVDPIDFRLQSLAQRGDTMITGDTWPSLGLAQCLEAARRHPLWTKRNDSESAGAVGLAAGYWPGQTQAAAALCRLDPDGVVSVLTAAVDVSGAQTGFATIVAEVIGVPLGAIRVVTADTDSAPLAPLSAGSVVTYAVGRAVQRAAEAVRDQLLEIVASRIEIDVSDLEIVEGVVRPKGSPERGIEIAEIARDLHGFGFGHPPVEGHGRSHPNGISPSSAVTLARTTVDPETGQVRVVDLAMIQDVGRALNPALVAGQMQGGMAQAVGWALLEGMTFDDRGNLVTGTFLDYAVPMATDVPNFDTVIVEIASEEGPLGAKGMAEMPVITGAAAIGNAIAAETMVRMRDLPMTSHRVWQAIQTRSGTRS